MSQKIKTFEEACKALKLNPLKCLPSIKETPKEDQEAILAHAKLVIIARALNGKWKPNWSNSSEYKYYPYFSLSSGFSFNDYDNDYSNSNISRHLSFFTIPVQTMALAKK